MTNRTERPPVLPHPLAYAPGLDVDGGTLRPLGESMNTGIADIAVGSIAQQSYPEPIVWTGGVGDPVCQWRPLFSPAYAQATIAVDAHADLMGARLIFASSGAGDTLELAVPMLARGRVEGTLDLAEFAGTGRENIKLSIDALMGDVRVYRIAIRYTPTDAGPIPTGEVDGAFPLGVDEAFEDGMPLSSGRVGRLLASQNRLLDARPRMLLSWSDAAGVNCNGVAARRGLPAHLLRGRAPRYARTASYPVAIRAEGGADDATLRVDRATSEITVAAASAEDWYTSTAGHVGPVDAQVFGVALRRVSVTTTNVPGERADADALSVAYSAHVEGP